MEIILKDKRASKRFWLVVFLTTYQSINMDFAYVWKTMELLSSAPLFF